MNIELQVLCKSAGLFLPSDTEMFSSLVVNVDYYKCNFFLFSLKNVMGW